jgi:hypothetical protein
LETTTKEHRATRHLTALGRDYPKFQDQYALFRQDREALGGWPDYVFCPLAAAFALVSGGGAGRVAPQKAPDIGRLGALAAWRPTKQIYRFDPELASILVSSPLAGDLPCELLRRLPAWCVYVESPVELQKQAIMGFFAHIEFDPKHKREELRLLCDMDNGTLLPIPLHLGNWGLERALDEMVAASGYGFAQPMFDARFVTTLAGMVSLLLYLCAEDADYVRPAWPRPSRTRRGEKLFAAQHPVTLDVGLRMGSALRRHRAQTREPPCGDSGQARSRPIGHVRSAHFHCFWRGPRDGERELFVKWLPPIGVNLALEDEEIVGVVRPVRNGEGAL